MAVVENEDRVEACQSVGDVLMRPLLPLMAQSFPELTTFGRQQLVDGLRRRAYLSGGDTVLLRGIDDGVLTGTAYDCQGE